MQEVVDTVESRLAPCICGRPRKQKHRKLCWSCTMFKHRYGLTWPEVCERRKTANQLCHVCDRLCRRIPILFNGYRVCYHCSKILHLLKDPHKYALIQMVLVQPKRGEL